MTTTIKSKCLNLECKGTNEPASSLSSLLALFPGCPIMSNFLTLLCLGKLLSSCLGYCLLCMHLTSSKMSAQGSPSPNCTSVSLDYVLLKNKVTFTSAFLVPRFLGIETLCLLNKQMSLPYTGALNSWGSSLHWADIKDMTFKSLELRRILSP